MAGTGVVVGAGVGVALVIGVGVGVGTCVGEGSEPEQAASAKTAVSRAMKSLVRFNLVCSNGELLKGC